ncbi:hypothetical protein [Microbacterium panaciterrae]|uniref:Uncharacterized protein n=1 Tax=Microbacterium panaciterrae TaxID=985759 RepID=A0ABP8PTV9_9MICO
MTAQEQSEHLHAALLELAGTSDRLAGRAAGLDELDASSALFVLADELRTMAQLVQASTPDEATFRLLDDGRWRISNTMLRLDGLERTTATLTSIGAEC